MTMTIPSIELTARRRFGASIDCPVCVTSGDYAPEWRRRVFCWIRGLGLQRIWAPARDAGERIVVGRDWVSPGDEGRRGRAETDASEDLRMLALRLSAVSSATASEPRGALEPESENDGGGLGRR